MPMQLNIGCGRSPTPGWTNYDNSPAVRLARWPRLAGLLERLGLIDRHTLAFVEACRRQGIRYADAARRIPQPSGAVDTIYSSHMLEHLDRPEARAFLAECRRVLKPGGILRLVVPDLRDATFRYLMRNSAEYFLQHLQFDLDKPRGLRERLRRTLTGGRGHHWMYDRDSLARLLQKAGFVDIESMEEGRTSIVEPGALNLYEREADSLCFEARQPLTRT